MNTTGSVTYNVTINTSGLSGDIADVNSKLSNAGATGAAGFGAKFGAIAGITQSIMTKAMEVVTDSIGNAIKRVDTLNNAPKVLQNLGYSADESAASIKKLNEHVMSLPTSLNGIVQSQVAIASATGKSIDAVTDLTLSFNDMALAGGQGPEAAERALVQYSQALSRGKFEGEEFNTMLEVMPAQMKQVASSLIGPTAGTGDLKQAMADGTVTMDQFNNEIIRLDKTGGAGFSSFEQQAKDATKGIGTSMENMNQAISRGVGVIIASIGNDNIVSAINGFGQAFESALNFVGTMATSVKTEFTNMLPSIINVATQVGDYLIPKFQALWASISTTLIPILQNLWNNILVPFASFVGVVLVGAIGFVVDALKFMTDGAGFLIPVIAGLIGGIVAWDAYLIISQGITTIWTAITGLATAAQIAWNVALLANPIGLVIGLVAALVTGIGFLIGSTQTDKDKTDDLTQANKNLKDAQDRLTETTMTLHTANLRAIEAKEREAVAIKNVQDMLDQFGINSPQYIKAQAQLEVAHDDTTTAIKNQTDAVKKNDDAITSVDSTTKKVDSAKKIEKAAYDGAAAWRKQTDDFGILGNKLNSFNGSTFSYNIVGNQSGPSAPPGRAIGGPVSRNTPYIVGEEGPELFVPKATGTIIPNDGIQGNGSSALVSQPTTVIVKLGEETIATRVIDLINNRSALAGYNSIMV